MSDLIKDIIKLAAVALIGAVGVVFADLYADFRGVEDKEAEIVELVDYKHKIDSLFVTLALQEKKNKQKELATWLNIKKQITNDSALTVEAMRIAEDTMFSVSVYQSDSIKKIMLSE